MKIAGNIMGVIGCGMCGHFMGWYAIPALLLIFLGEAFLDVADL